MTANPKMFGRLALGDMVLEPPRQAIQCEPPIALTCVSLLYGKEFMVREHRTYALITSAQENLIGWGLHSGLACYTAMA
jgi:hypothetical protein